VYVVGRGYDRMIHRNDGRSTGAATQGGIMIVKFSTRAGALTMHGDAAVALLRAMGHSGTVPGAILAAELPGALASLRRALEAQAETAPVVPDSTDDADEGDEDRQPPVTLAMRAVPLIDMIETAIARGSDLMWERG
jgi:hypothetical protein